MTLVVLGGATAGDRLADALAAVRCPSDRDPHLSVDLLAGAIAETSPAAVAIIVGTPGTRLQPRPLACMSDVDWAAAFEQPLREARIRLQAAGKASAQGGRVILLATTGGMAGVDGDVATCGVEEGTRALAKSVALAWLPRRITLAFAAFGDAAFSAPDGPAAIVAPTVRMLLAAPPELSGSTVIADGAMLLAP